MEARPFVACVSDALVEIENALVFVNPSASVAWRSPWSTTSSLPLPYKSLVVEIRVGSLTDSISILIGCRVVPPSSSVMVTLKESLP